MMEKKRIFYYDFIRTVAMFIIIIFHFNCSLAIHNISGKIFLGIHYANGSYADVGVPLFFILSGATLMLSNQKNYTLKSFYKKRFYAIYPLYWEAYFCVLVYLFLKYKSLHPFVSEPRHWTVLLSVIGMDGYYSAVINTFYLVGEWFLGCLIVMYIAFPLLRIGVKKYPKVTVSIIMAIYFIVINYYIFPEAVYQNIFVRLPEFVFGMYMAEYCKKVHIFAFLLSLLGAGILFTVNIKDISSIYLILLMGVCCYLVLVYTGQKLEGCVKEDVKKVFSWIGKYSYAIYLLHHVISEQIISSFEGIPLSMAGILMLFIIVIIADFCGGYFLLKLNQRLICIRN